MLFYCYSKDEFTTISAALSLLKLVGLEIKDVKKIGKA